MTDDELKRLIEKSRKEAGVDFVLDTTEEEVDWLHRRTPPKPVQPPERG
ncbi:MAG: hypothetical protein H0T44_06770 [Gemmatimonadales bacterium]|nr:hypothetical protein [Gemmatimonadales bacterium]